MKQLVQDSPTSTVEVLPKVNTTEIALQRTSQKSEQEDAEDSFFICDLGDVIAKHQRWKRVFPRIHPCYAIKCNPCEPILRSMIAMGTGFDCASKAEIAQMLRLGAKPSHIIFANPCKQSSHIKFARDHGVDRLVFDNEIEIQKIKRLYPGTKLVLRIQTDDSASICRFSMKYGAHPDSCCSLIDAAKNLGMDVVGVSFHVGSGCQDPTAFVKALQLARKLFDYSKQIGYNFSLLDIGGGFPGTENVQLTFEEIASIVNATLDDLFPARLFKSLEIIAEPGRYYAASAFTLVTNVIAKRKVSRDRQSYHDDLAAKDAVLNGVLPSKCDEPAFMYFLNDGVYGSFNCLLYDHAEVTPAVLKTLEKDPPKFSSSVWGPTCDGLDRVIEHCLLPELDVGDWVIWKDMGAYTVAAGSAFNGFKTSVITFVISEENLSLLQTLSNRDPIPELCFKLENTGKVEAEKKAFEFGLTATESRSDVM